MAIFLTSTSARRKALLRQLGFREHEDFIAAAIPGTPEFPQPSGPFPPDRAIEVALALARQKVRATISGGHLAAQGLLPEETVVIGVQTLHLLDGRPLDRPLVINPGDATSEQLHQAQAHARTMLEALRDREMTVITGLVVSQGDNEANQRLAWAKTVVQMRPYDERDIEAYIATGEDLAQPGGLDLQGRGVVLHEKIRGTFSNIGGLPLVELVTLLRDPLFQGRLRFRLDEVDQGRFSTPVKEGRPRNRIVSLTGDPPDFYQVECALLEAEVLHVPGSFFKAATIRPALVDLMTQARKRGRLVVLDDGPAVRQYLGPDASDQLLRNAVNCLADSPVTTRQLAQYMSPRLLLASQSPRRCELLKQIVARNQVEVRASQNEEPYLDESPQTRVKRLALEKARAVFKQQGLYSPSIEVVIGADTEVVMDGQALGKPADAGEARRQLQLLSGRTHRVLTGMAFIGVPDGREVVDCVETLVTFGDVSDEEIETYIASGEPFGKAGAYGIQGKGVLFIEAIDGSYSNVVGLPLERLAQILEGDFNLPVWRLDPVSGWRLPR